MCHLYTCTVNALMRSGCRVIVCRSYIARAGTAAAERESERERDSEAAAGVCRDSCRSAELMILRRGFHSVPKLKKTINKFRFNPKSSYGLGYIVRLYNRRRQRGAMSHGSLGEAFCLPCNRPSYAFPAPVGLFLYCLIFVLFLPTAYAGQALFFGAAPSPSPGSIPGGPSCGRISRYGCEMLDTKEVLSLCFQHIPASFSVTASVSPVSSASTPPPSLLPPHPPPPASRLFVSC